MAQEAHVSPGCTLADTHTPRLRSTCHDGQIDGHIDGQIDGLITCHAIHILSIYEHEGPQKIFLVSILTHGTSNAKLHTSAESYITSLPGVPSLTRTPPSFAPPAMMVKLMVKSMVKSMVKLPAMPYIFCQYTSTKPPRKPFL